ncbi:MAG: alanine:cation symporter family protein, partial [Intestinibacter sp.]
KKFTGGKSSKLSINCLRIVLLGMTAFGCVKSAGLAWTMGDIGVGMMAWLNLIAILILSKTVFICFNDYEAQMKSGVPRDEISFDPIKLGIKGADFWEQKSSNKA